MTDATEPQQPTLAGMGHNRPPMTAEERAEVQRQDLIDRHAKLIKRRDDLLAARDRVPAELGTTEEAERQSDFIGQFITAAKLAEEAHKDEKRPWLEGGRVVDTLFLGDTAQVLRKAAQEETAKLNRYNNKVREREAAEARERERLAREAEDKARAEERAKREEADRKAEEARKAEADAKALEDFAKGGDADAAKDAQAKRAEADRLVTEAITAEGAADQAKVAASEAVTEQVQAVADLNAKPTDQTRARGYGTTSSQRSVWRWQLTKLDDVPRKYLVLDEARITKLVGAGERDIPGIRIYEDFETRVTTRGARTK